MWVTSKVMATNFFWANTLQWRKFKIYLWKGMIYPSDWLSQIRKMWWGIGMVGKKNCTLRNDCFFFSFFNPRKIQCELNLNFYITTSNLQSSPQVYQVLAASDEEDGDQRLSSSMHWAITARETSVWTGHRLSTTLQVNTCFSSTLECFCPPCNSSVW